MSAKKENKLIATGGAQDMSEVSRQEEETLAFWHKNRIFEQSLENTRGGEPFVFYDGPPFATGLPHYGHLLAGTMKDVLPRYQTMRGRYVRRQWGWDCHGLPVENLIEDELGLNSKKDIEEYGVCEFNEAARASVMRYDTEWKQVVPRFGRFVDMETSYRTMDWQYSESIWWAFKELWDKGHVYEGYKSMHICPRCETTLSNNEVADGYKDIKDISVTAQFELVDEPGTFVLAWTTTPWTLPGNVALAVGPDIEYVVIEKKDEGAGGVIRFVLAKEKVEQMFGDQEFNVVNELKGKDLLGKSYKPIFDYYANDTSLENHANGWKIYPADFVTTEDGTGVVHIAPAFGEDDMNLGKEHKLPFIQHVDMSGHMKSEVTDFAGKLVKPKDDKEAGVDHMQTDIEIVKYLAHAGTLFAKEKYEHSYPHCWRCKTPLLNYAASSWFINVSEFRDELIASNNDISWVPDAMKHGRFGNWLEGARDWAISRSRYWGAPFPVWRCDECEHTFVAGGVEDIRQKTKTGTTIILMRHGEADSNVQRIISSKVDNPHHVTEKGRQQVAQAAKELRDREVDVIITSPFVRTKETATLVAEGLNIDPKTIVEDARIQEPDFGEFDGKPEGEYHACFTTDEERFTKNCPGGENLTDVKKRVGDFLYDIDTKYAGKTVLVVSHDYPSWLMQTVARGLDVAQSAKEKGSMYLHNAEVTDLDFASLPHNAAYELDLHRPYIDAVAFPCTCGGVMRRIPDVFDCWFESGSMPYAQFHYPFENMELFDEQFPADFIAEGVDQTRGWFYNMLVLSTALFGKSSFRNVIVNGIILAEDGQKMSKSLKNYPDPMEVVHRYGADAVRYYLMASPVVRAESLNFSEKGVAEVYRKVIARLDNVASFYDLFREDFDSAIEVPASTHVLDHWITARLRELEATMKESLDHYELDKATRPIGDFVDDLSTWYVRRSRNRIKAGGGDGAYALATLRYVCLEFAKLIAPIIPFTAERLYQRISNDEHKESVHLESWPKYDKDPQDADLLATMTHVREIVSQALEARARAGLKVRQPLARLTINHVVIADNPALAEIIADEVNVKEVTGREVADGDMLLDTELTDELREEGDIRELIRRIQEMRKHSGLTPKDAVILQIDTTDRGREILGRHETSVLGTVRAKSVEYLSLVSADEIMLGGETLGFALKRVQ